MGASLAIHALFFLVAYGVRLPDGLIDQSIEIDLTNPLLGPGAPKLGAPKRLTPGAVLPPRPAPEPLPVTPEQARPAPEPPKDWVLPGPNTQKTEAPAPPPATQGGAEDGAGTSHKDGGKGEGFDYGEIDGTGGGGGTVDVWPKLLNRDEVLANLRRFYPESERVAGREGDVIVAIHIGTDGNVSSVDIMGSGGKAFDGAAAQVARLMRFSPAMKRGSAVRVKIKQTMVFQLE